LEGGAETVDYAVLPSTGETTKYTVIQAYRIDRKWTLTCRWEKLRRKKDATVVYAEHKLVSAVGGKECGIGWK
jgi:hypothetical protein